MVPSRGPEGRFVVDERKEDKLIYRVSRTLTGQGCGIQVSLLLGEPRNQEEYYQG